MSILSLDHVVLACANLDAGTVWLEQKLGVPLAPGGKHLGFGTHNRLLQLAGGAYLELIAPDPSQGKVSQAMPFGLDLSCPKLPTLIHYVCSTPNIETCLPQLFYVPGIARAMKRDQLQWKIATLGSGPLPLGGLLPTVIEWPPNVHPSKTLPHQGVSLLRLSLAADADLLKRLQAVLNDLRINWLESAQPWLGLELQTPLGRVFL